MKHYLGSFALFFILATSSTVAQPPVLPPPSPVPPPAVVARPLTIHEFARVFQPLPGTHVVDLCHPYTGKTVRVCFTLPPGCLKVIVRKKLLCYELDFDYGKYEVELNFGRRGRVRVK